MKINAFASVTYFDTKVTINLLGIDFMIKTDKGITMCIAGTTQEIPKHPSDDGTKIEHLYNMLNTKYMALIERQEDEYDD